MKAKDSKPVKLGVDLKKQVEEYAESLKPRSNIQAVVEMAVEEFLIKYKDKGRNLDRSCPSPTGLAAPDGEAKKKKTA